MRDQKGGFGRLSHWPVFPLLQIETFILKPWAFSRATSIRPIRWR